jgi:hypothetical protein
VDDEPRTFLKNIKSGSAGDKENQRIKRDPARVELGLSAGPTSASVLSQQYMQDGLLSSERDLDKIIHRIIDGLEAKVVSHFQRSHWYDMLPFDQDRGTLASNKKLDRP